MKAIKPRSAIALMTVGLILGTSSLASATKPCWALPCEQGDGACWQKEAGWIATGTLANIHRQPKGRPLMKDFAEFELNITQWEKAEGPKPERLEMKVGWCVSRQQLPTDTVGTFRFYGLRIADSPKTARLHTASYLAFERVSCPKEDGCNDVPPKIVVDDKGGVQQTTSDEPSRPPENDEPRRARQTSTTTASSTTEASRGKGQCGCRMVGAGSETFGLWSLIGLALFRRTRGSAQSKAGS